VKITGFLWPGMMGLQEISRGDYAERITGNGAAIVPDTFCYRSVDFELNINYKLHLLDRILNAIETY
jgi:hypothetical protein